MTVAQRCNVSHNALMASLKDVEAEFIRIVSSTNFPRVLITGCPRSGTTAVTQYYLSRGLIVGHECPGVHVTVDYKAIHEVDDYPVVIALVRHPLKTIESLAELFLNADRRFRYQLARVYPDFVDETDEVLAALNYWTWTYERLKSYPHIRIEDMDINRVNRHLHSYELTEEELMERYPAAYGTLVEVAAHYGYTLLPF